MIKYLFSYVHQTNLKLNRKLMVVEAQIFLILCRFLAKQRISFDEGIFCSLIDSDTRFQQNLTDLLGCWYIL